MTEKRIDRGLLIVAKTDLKLAKVALADNDSAMINQCLSHTIQAAEKIIKFLCSDQGIDYTCSHFIGSLIDDLLVKGVYIPELVQEKAEDYGRWSTQSRYSSSQLVQRSFIERHYNCINEWLQDIQKKYQIMDMF